MDLSLAHLKKVLKFGILLVGIQFVDLKSCFGESNLKGYTFINHGYILPNSALTDVKFADDFNDNWLKDLTTPYGSEALVRQIQSESSMMDSQGDRYSVSFRCVLKEGMGVNISRPGFSSVFYPWYLLDSSINCSEAPSLPLSVDKNLFKNCFHNTVQPCIAQEVGTNSSKYLYVFFYIPPTRYMNTKNTDNEGILMLKLTKSNTKVVEQKFYPGADNAVFRFDHQRPRRDSDSYAFGPECGNYQAWVDTDDSGTDHVHLNWIALETANDFSTARIYQLYANIGTVTKRNSNACNSGGRCIFPRAIKFGEYIYTMYSWNGLPSIHKQKKDSTNTESAVNLTDQPTGLFVYTNHSQAYNAYTAKNYDFCIVDNGGSPIFCVLGLRATSETDNTKTSLSGKNNERWSSKCINDPSKIVLILSSFTSSDSGITINDDRSIEDPQNIIYSTGKTSAESCSTTCGCYSNTYDGYGDKQLFKNTHKLVTYTSDSGNKYIIYCYCYPGKSKQLVLGYAPYYISNNKVHLLTKTEFSPPPTNNVHIEGGFASCSRIISMDLKNGQLWIQWINADSTKEYSFHIAAKDLVGE